jgi:putative ABC transport system ATP-binding protein
MDDGTPQDDDQLRRGVRLTPPGAGPDGSAPVTQSVPKDALPSQNGDLAVDVAGLERTYVRGDIRVPVLKDLDLQVRHGEWIACTGRSGSGKSTLLNVLGLLDSPDAGTYVLAGHDVAGLDDAERAWLRNDLLGFVFQLHNLLPRTTALDNVATPLIYRGVRRRERLRRAREALEQVGLSDRADHDPSELSGGQMQRVAIARALVGDPAVLFVDEPTGNLDLVATAEVLEILDRLHAEGRTIVMITHEEDVAEHADRRLVLADGRLHPHS